MGYLHGLTAVRGVAAIWVALCHAYTAFYFLPVDPESSIGLMMSKGWLGVDLFFILSGFIITFSYETKLSKPNKYEFKSYIKKRLARLYPAHIVVLLCYFAIVALGSHLGKMDTSNYTTSRFISQLFLVNGLGFGVPEGWNAPSWSVSSELLAYLLFPALLLSILKFKKHMQVGIGIILINVFLSIKINNFEQYMLGFSWVSLRVISEFMLGMLLYKVFTNSKPKLWPLPVGAVMVTLHSVLKFGAFWDWLFLVYFMMIIYGCASIRVKRPVPILGHLGEISYSLYLCHSLILIGFNFLLKALPDFRPGLLIILALYLGVSIVFAKILYSWIEIPGQKLCLDISLNSILKKARAPVLLRRG